MASMKPTLGLLSRLAPKLLQQGPSYLAAASQQAPVVSQGLHDLLQASCQQAVSAQASFSRSFAADAAVAPAKDPEPLTPTNRLSMSPSNHIKYDEHHHVRYPPGTDGRPFAYFVQAGGRFLYASAARLAVLKVLVSLSAAADTLALSSLEVDLSSIEEGQTITVKWRGKPVFIKHRSEEDIETVDKGLNLTELKDPQKDADRVIDPKYLIVIGVCTHLGCVPIAGAGNYSGWFCPCHGSHYDGSGRIREGPAPYNLEVPEYRFLDPAHSKVMIG